MPVAKDHCQQRHRINASSPNTARHCPDRIACQQSKHSKSQNVQNFRLMPAVDRCKPGSMTDSHAVEGSPCSCTPVTLSCCTTMFSAQVPKQILTPRSVRCCLKACSMRTSRSVPKCGLPDTSILCKHDKQSLVAFSGVMSVTAWLSLSGACLAARCSARQQRHVCKALRTWHLSGCLGRLSVPDRCFGSNAGRLTTL